MKRSRLYYILNGEKMRERSRKWRESIRNGTHIPTKRDELYTTREELIKASEEDPEETGEINWQLWEKLVSEFHEKYLNDEYLVGEKQNGRRYKQRYVFNEYAQLVCSGSSKEVSDKLKELGVHMSPENVVTCSCSERWTNGFFFSNHNYSGHELLILKKNIKISKKYGSMERYNRL